MRFSSIKRLVPVLPALAAACAPSSTLKEPQGPPKPPEAAPSTEAPAKEEVAPHAAGSTEGMWLLNDFPAERVGRDFGFTPTPEWLEEVRLSSMRLAGGCSGSVVSDGGLVMTNHHCVHRCVEQLSSAKEDYVANGFFAKTAGEEKACPGMELNQLVEITDVTARVSEKTESLSGERFFEAQKAELSRIEKECATGSDLRCDVVSLYQGGRYHLYKYRRFQDVRLVFAPELAAAFFGGDPDNFNFPRYVLDAAFLRIYEDGRPLATPHHFTFSQAGASEDELVFVSGHPGSTSRNLTVAELELIRDVMLPARLLRLAEVRGLLTEYAERGKEQARVSKGTLFGVENAFKALNGRQAALLDRELFAGKVEAENELRAKVANDPELAAAYGGAWEAIREAQGRMRQIRVPYQQLEQGAGFWSDLFNHARTLVRAAEEFPKPNEERLREYSDARRPALEQGLFSTAPIDADFEIRKLSYSLTKLREELGTDDPRVRKLLGKESPMALATAAVRGTKLSDPKARRALFEGGKAALDASKDPMIALAKAIDEEARAIRKVYEDEVESVVRKHSELVARARFAIFGTSVYPDATFTLRLSFGKVEGWDENGAMVAPTTSFAGAFDRDTGADPYALPKSWLSAKPKLNLGSKLNFVTTNDIIGGNSGSPVINQEREIVGLIFDGNIHSLGGEYAFDQAKNRAVAVHSEGIVEALDTIYGAKRIVDELRPKDGGEKR